MPNPTPINESAVRIHAISVRSAASRLRSFASSLAMLAPTGLSLIGDASLVYPACRGCHCLGGKISNSVGGRLHRLLQRRAGIEVRRCLAWREILEGFRVQLQDVGCWHDGPRLLPGVERVARGIHMLLERIDPEVDRARDSRSH